MPFKTEKRLSLNDFVSGAKKRLEGNPAAIACLEIFLTGNLASDLAREAGFIPPDDQLLAPGDFDVVFPFVATKLHQAASRNYSEVHSDAYDVADAVGEALRAQLNEFFECSGNDEFDPIRIKSYAELIARVSAEDAAAGG